MALFLLNILKRIPGKRSCTVYRQMFVILLGLSLEGAAAAKPHVTIGLAAVDEGDDRSRPAAILRGGLDHFYGSVAAYGRTFAQVSERTIHVAAGARAPIFHTRWLTAGIGMAAIEENTVVKSRGSQTKTEQDAIYNIGVQFGLQAEYQAKQWILQAGWESTLFPAGLATVFLTTGRKQFIFATAGYQL